MIRNLLINRSKPNKIAVIEGDKEITYDLLRKKALALQMLLPANARENIAILLPNGSDYIAALWGTLAAGMTAFPLNISMTGHEIMPLLCHARVKTVITSRIFHRLLFTAMPSHESDSFAIIDIQEIKIQEGSQGYLLNTDPDEAMLLLNTSGTTGKPKIVQLSERNVEASVLGYLDKLMLEETESDVRFLLAAPFSSVYGIMILSACLIRSFPLVILEPPFTLDALYRCAEKNKVTHYEGGTATILLMERMIGKPIPYNIDSLIYFGFGGSKIPGHTIKRLYDAYKGKHFFLGYGMTEAAPLITKHPNALLKKMESVGTAIKGLSIAIDTGNELVCTPHTKGELVISGANVMLGYYENEAETERVLKGGYLYTGDIGYLDEEGHLYLCGRKKNIINVQGFKVYPEEVEECIQSSLLVKDCVVYGQTDTYGNETVFADIVPINAQIKEEEIWTHCFGHLAWYKRPSRILLCEQIYRNEAGKVGR